MTFEQFQATRDYSNDIGEKIGEARWDREDQPAIGYIYLGSLYIEEVQPHWPKAARDAGKWYLLIGNTDWVSNDLESLERKLFDFATSEGYKI